MKTIVETQDDDISEIMSRKKIQRNVIISFIVSFIILTGCLFLSLYGFNYMKRITDSEINIILYLDDIKIGYIENIAIIPEVMTEVVRAVYNSNGAVYTFNEKITYKIENTSEPVEYIGKNELIAAFMENSTYRFIKAVGLFIDGTFAAACKNEEEINSILRKVEKIETEHARSVSFESASIINNVTLTEGNFLIEDVLSSDQLYNRLVSFLDTDNIIAQNDVPQTVGMLQRDDRADQNVKVVSDSDLLSVTEPEQNNENINDNEPVSDDADSDMPGTGTDVIAAAKIGMPVNPADKERVIIRSACSSADTINDDIDYGIHRIYTDKEEKAEPDKITLKFKYIKYETVTETIERKTIYRYNEYFFNDFEMLLNEGEDGCKSTMYRLEYVGNDLTVRRIVNSQVLKAPDDRVLLAGVRDYPEAGVTADEYIWPLILLTEPVITSYYGERRPEYDGSGFHLGLDIQAETSTPVLASNGGVVSYVDRTNSYGIMIMLEHDGGVQTRYAHLDKAFVQVGDIIYQGQLIGTAGNTGVSTSSHLHFEIRIDFAPEEPFNFLLQEPWKYN